MRLSSGLQGELDLIKKVFVDEDCNEKNILEVAERLYQEGEKNIYARLLHIMCHLRLEAAEARDTWHNIIRHNDFLEKKLGRHTGFRVAMLDYFVNESHEIKNPKVIEIHVYAETARQAAVDELTGLYNRRFFEAALEREIKQAHRHARELSLLMIDIDNFKKINDTHGHATGDAVISALGRLLKRSIRREDTACRIGGEEFVVLFPETSADGALVVSEKIRTEFASLNIEGCTLSISGGLATFPGDAQEAAALIKDADQMLYFAKYSGKNRIVCFANNKRRHIRYPLQWELSLKRQEGGNGQALSQDVSIEGISFEFDGEATPGENMDLSIAVDTHSLELPVEIVWVDAAQQNKRLRAGARFLFPSEENARSLREQLPLSFEAELEAHAE